MSTPPTLQLEYGTLYQSQSLGQKKTIIRLLSSCHLLVCISTEWFQTD